MDGSWVCYDELRVWRNFNIPQLDSSPCPLIFGEIVPNFARKLTVQHMKTGKHSFERGIVTIHFEGKYAILPLPIWRKRGGHVVQVSDESITIALLLFVRWRLYQVDSPLLWRMTEKQPSSSVM